MLQGHREAQVMFEELGKALGYKAKRSYSPELPTDGVWFHDSALPLVAQLPHVAVEVVVSESPKKLRGSITTLEQVSPGLGVVLIQEDEIHRRFVRRSKETCDAEEEVRRLRTAAQDLVVCTRQRLVVLSMSQLRAWFKLYTGKRSIHQVLTSQRGEKFHDSTGVYASVRSA